MALFGLDQLKNFAEANVASGGFSSGATSFNLVTGQGARFPVPDGTAALSFPVIVWNATDYPNPVDDPNKEIILVGSNAADVFGTLTRGYDGTTAQNHNTGGKTYKVTLAASYNLFAQLAAGLGCYGDDYGAANAYKINLSVLPAAIKKGMTFVFKAANSNTASSTLQVLAQNTSLVTATIKKRNGTNLVADDIKTGDIIEAMYDGTNFQIQTPSPEVGYGTDSGVANGAVVSIPELRSQLVTGMKICFIPAATNTGASTINFNSTGLKTIKRNGTFDLVAGDLVAGQFAELRYDGTNWQLMNPNNDLMLCLAYQLATNTSGATATQNAWTKYPINTIIQNDIAMGAISSNQFVLPVGTYEVVGGAISFGNTTNCVARLRNTTDSADILIAQSSFSSNGGSMVNCHFLVGQRFTIAAGKTLEIDYYQVAASPTNPFAFAFSGPAVVENWGYISLKKVA